MYAYCYFNLKTYNDKHTRDWLIQGIDLFDKQATVRFENGSRPFMLLHINQNNYIHLIEYFRPVCYEIKLSFI